MKKRMKGHPCYASYNNMKARCNNPNDDRYNAYGARGIKVCDRWLTSFWLFLEDMGEKPTPQHTLDRVDNDGDYTPENCQWSLMERQYRNKQDSIFLEVDGKKMHIKDACELLGIPYLRTKTRHYRGLSNEQILQKEDFPEFDIRSVGRAGSEAARERNLAKTHCKRGHQLSGDNLYTTEKGRSCVKCRRAASKKARDKKKTGADLPIEFYLK